MKTITTVIISLLAQTAFAFHVASTIRLPRVGISGPDTIALSHDGTRLFAHNRVWNPLTGVAVGAPIFPVPGAGEAMFPMTSAEATALSDLDAVYLADGRLFFVGQTTEKVTVIATDTRQRWETKIKTKLTEWEPPRPALSRDGKWLAVAESNPKASIHLFAADGKGGFALSRTVKLPAVFDEDYPHPHAPFTETISFVQAMTFSPDGRALYIAGEFTGVYELFGKEWFRFPATFEASPDKVEEVIVNAEAGELYVRTFIGGTSAFDLKTHAYLRNLTAGTQCLSSSGRRLTTWDDERKEIDLFVAATGKKLFAAPKATAYVSARPPVAFSADDRAFAFVTYQEDGEATATTYVEASR